MKRIIFFCLTLLCCSTSYAQTTTIVTDKTSPKVIHWESNKSNPSALPGGDVVTIHNGNGAPIKITITVDNTGSGISVKNCGNTTNIEAGSTAICTTSDPVNPVSFTSLDPNIMASGTYIIESQ